MYKDIWKDLSAWFFDGACKQRHCGCGALIVIEPGRFYHFWWEGGRGTNNKANIIALWGILSCSRWLGLEIVHIYGDAEGIIEWVKGRSLFSPTILSNWMSHIRNFADSFQNISFGHIYREQNQIEDLLSKRGIRKELGKSLFYSFVNNRMHA